MSIHLTVNGNSGDLAKSSISQLHMFERSGPLTVEGFSGSGADFLEQLKHYVLDGSTIVASPHKMWGPESNDLALQLRKQDVSQIVLAGMAANLCVESHLRHLLEEGFEVAVVRDATASARVPTGDGYLAALTNYKLPRARRLVDRRGGLAYSRGRVTSAVGNRSGWTEKVFLRRTTAAVVYVGSRLIIRESTFDTRRKGRSAMSIIDGALSANATTAKITIPAATSLQSLRSRSSPARPPANRHRGDAGSRR